MMLFNDFSLLNDLNLLNHHFLETSNSWVHPQYEDFKYLLININQSDPSKKSWFRISYRFNRKLQQTLKRLVKIHNEIIECNNNYWSIFLFWLCLIYIEVNAMALYFILFVKLNIVYKLIFIYSIINATFILMYPMITCCSLAKSVTKSVNIIIHLFAKNNKILRFDTKFKVWIRNIVFIY